MQDRHHIMSIIFDDTLFRFTQHHFSLAPSLHIIPLLRGVISGDLLIFSPLFLLFLATLFS